MAKERQLAERYLLNELSDQDRDDFEAHYFDCAECADDVKAAFALRDNLVAVLKDRPRVVPFPAPSVHVPGKASPLRMWAIPAAAALLLGVVTWQSAIVIPGLRQEVSTLKTPRALPGGLARVATRGALSTVVLSDADQFFRITMDVQRAPGPDRAIVRTEDGASALTVPVEVDESRQVDLLLPASEFAPGRYRVSLGSEEFVFIVERK